MSQYLNLEDLKIKKSKGNYRITEEQKAKIEDAKQLLVNCANEMQP